MHALIANGFACAPHTRECGVRRTSYAELLLQSKFVFSPRGLGHQNHRDWEALLAGSVPLVDDDEGLAPMWDSLPVVRVRNWSAVTQNRLDWIWQRMHVAKQNLSWTKVYLPYWLDRLLHAPAAAEATRHQRPPSEFIIE